MRMFFYYFILELHEIFAWFQIQIYKQKFNQRSLVSLSFTSILSLPSLPPLFFHFLSSRFEYNHIPKIFLNKRECTILYVL